MRWAIGVISLMTGERTVHSNWGSGRSEGVIGRLCMENLLLR